MRPERKLAERLGVLFEDLVAPLNLGFHFLRILRARRNMEESVAFISGGQSVDSNHDTLETTGNRRFPATKGITNQAELRVRTNRISQIYK